MNILHISRTMGQGGAEKVVFQLCKDNKEFKSVVVSCGGFYEKDLSTLGVKYYNIPDIDNKNIINVIKTLFLLIKVIKIEQIDIIHSHHRMAAFYSRIICLFLKKHRVYTAHNVFYNKKLLLRWSLKGSKIVAVGNGVKQNLVNHYQISENKIQVVYNSVESNIMNEENKVLSNLLKEGKVLVGTIGRLSEQKGIDVFIKAIAEVVKLREDVVGVIIGDGEEKQNLTKLVDKLGIKKEIIFLGYQKNVLDIIDQLHFIVLASRWEGLPLTPIETFSRNKTIIASNISGNNEIVKDGLNGLLVEKENFEELSKKILLLLGDSELLECLEENAYNSYVSNYSYHTFINGYLNIYKSIL